MSDKGSKTQLCGVCHGAPRSDAKLYICDNCKKSYHSACAKLASVAINNVSGKACPTCIAKSTPSLNDSRPRRVSNSSLSDAAEPSGTSDMLENILKGIGGLRTSVDSRFDKLEAKLAELDGIGVRVATNEAGLDEVKRDLAAIKQRLDSSECNGASSSTEADTKIQLLERVNKDLSSKISKLSAQQAQLSQDLVMRGLCYESTADLCLLSMTALMAVYPELHKSHVLQTRSLVVKKTTDSDRQGNCDRKLPIIVTLSSSALVRVIIQAEVRAGKLHTNSIDQDILKKAGFVTSQAGLVNISAFLPREIHTFRTLVRQQAKDKGFTTFLRNEKHFARWEDRDKFYLMVS